MCMYIETTYFLCYFSFCRAWNTEMGIEIYSLNAKVIMLVPFPSIRVLGWKSDLTFKDELTPNPLLETGA